MTGNDYIELASRLLLSSIGQPEARYRSAVSRAYYGAFHLAVTFLNEVGAKVPANSECHQQAYQALLNSGNVHAQEAARLLDDLRTSRNEADYKLHKKRLADQGNAMIDVGMAGDFQSKLKSCDEEPHRSEIRAAFSK